MPKEFVKSKVRRVKLVFVIMTFLFFLILAGFAWVITDIRELSQDTQQLAKDSKNLSKENQKRINEIQVSRVASCKKTYTGIHEVFEQFFPPPPRTAQQQSDLRKFNSTIINLRQGCVEQTKPKKKEPKHESQ